MFKDLKIYFLIAGAYLFLTIIFTWPVILNFNSAIPSWGNDSFQVFGKMMEKTQYLQNQGFFPGILNLLKINGLNSIFLYAIFGYFLPYFATYNAALFFSYIISGFGGFLLARYVIKKIISYYGIKNYDRTLVAGAAFFGGMIFAFAPLHTYNSLSTNVGTMHQEWIPFFMLSLMKFFDTFKFKWYFATAFFLALIALTEHQLLAFTLLFVLYFAGYEFFVNRKIFTQKIFWQYFFLTTIFFGILAAVFFLPMIKVALSENNYLNPGINQATNYSNDFFAWLIPPATHPLWGGWFDGVREQFRRNNPLNSVFIGYSVIGAVGYAGYVLRKKCSSFKKFAASPIFFWILGGLLFYIFSIGPYLHFLGLVSPKITMPYWLVYHTLPFYENIRTVGRLAVYTVFCFSVVAAVGMFLLGKKLKQRYLLIIAAVCLVLLEFWVAPLEMNRLEHSSLYEKMGREDAAYNIIEIPGSTSYAAASRNMIWRQIHHKNSLGGFDFARVIEETNALQKSTPVIADLLFSLPLGNQLSEKDIFKQDYPSLGSQVLNSFNVKYIIISKEFIAGISPETDPEGRKMTSEEVAALESFIQRNIKYKERHEDDFVIAYRVDELEIPRDVFLSFYEGKDHWSTIQKSEGGRHIDSGAKFKIMNFGSSIKSGKLIFDMYPRKEEEQYKVKIFQNDKLILEKDLPPAPGGYIESLPLDLAAGSVNVITLKIFDRQGNEVVNTKKTPRTVVVKSIEFK
jgi:hypothetical protein